MSIKIKNSQKVLLIVHPNISILDQWLPVVYHLRKIKQNLNIIGVIIKNNVVKEINKKHFLSQYGDELLDGVIVIKNSELGYYRKSFCKAIVDQDKRFSIENSRRARMLLPWRRARALIDLLLLFLRRFYFKRYEINLTFAFSKSVAVLTDISYIEEPGVLSIINRTDCKFVGCLPHGKGVSAINANETPYVTKGIPYEKKENSINLKVFIELDNIYETYSKKFGLCAGEIEISGNPKYDSEWMSFLRQGHNYYHNPGKYIYGHL